jgi:hypothetical protein
MRAVLGLLALMVVLAVPSPSWALWLMAHVGKAEAKELKIDVKTEEVGPNHYRVTMEFVPEGKLKEYVEGPMVRASHVEMTVGDGDNPPVSAALREHRTKDGKVSVIFTVERTQVDKIRLHIWVPSALTGTVFVMQMKDFVEAKK